MRSRLLNRLPLRRFVVSTTSLLGAANLLLLLALRMALAAPPASGQAKKTKAASPLPLKQVADIDCWYGVFMDSQHIGYVHFGVKQKASTAPRLKEYIEEASLSPAPGTPPAFHMLRRSLERQDGETVESWDTVTADGKTTTTHHKYSEKDIRAGKNVDKDDSPLPLDFVGPNSLKKLPKGWVVGKEEVVIVDYKPISATHITATGQTDESNGSYWVDRDRQLVRADVDLSGDEMRLERMSQASAVHTSTSLLQADVITPTVSLDAPRTQRNRSYLLSGLFSLPKVPNDDVETVTSLKQPDGHYTAVIQVSAAPLDEKASPAIAAIDKTKFAPYLASTRLTPSNDPEMIALARQIVGTETNSARAAKSLCQWVHTNLSYDWDFSGYRSAQQTLKDRRGVCQNYATLLLTLARASGIPAKYCNGPAYSNDGKFYRHAWVECWTGKWVALEPTWGQDYADASHVKLAEGDPDAPLDAWNNTTPPTIDIVAPNADVAKIIRDLTAALASDIKTTLNAVTVTTTTTTPSPPALPNIDTAKEELLAKQIQSSAALPPSEVAVIQTDPVRGTLVLLQLPWGSTTRIVQSKVIRGGDTNALLSGIQYTLPDGRTCLVIFPGRQKPEDLEALLAKSFETRLKDGTWTHGTIAPYKKFDGDMAGLAASIKDATIPAGYRIMYVDPPSANALLPLLPQGTTATAMEDPDERDSKGHLLTGTTYHLPDGKSCVVMKMGNFE